MGQMVSFKSEQRWFCGKGVSGGVIRGREGSEGTSGNSSRQQTKSWPRPGPYWAGRAAIGAVPSPLTLPCVPLSFLPLIASKETTQAVWTRGKIIGIKPKALPLDFPGGRAACLFPSTYHLDFKSLFPCPLSRRSASSGRWVWGLLAWTLRSQHKSGIA